MDIVIRPLEWHDLGEADRIFRLAFGTFIGLPDPMSFMGDADLIKTRWLAEPSATFGAYHQGELVGSNFAARWGSFGFFGPLTVRPDLWDQGIGGELLAATMALFDSWGTRQVGLFTFPHSPKHIWCYQRLGFWPQTLTPVMSKAIERKDPDANWMLYSDLPSAERDRSLDACSELTGSILEGLDVRREIRALSDQNIGDTILLQDGSGISGLAVCHSGKGSEAGSGSAYVKFAAARPGAGALERFDRLLSACEAFAGLRGATQLMAGVNTSREPAYARMLERGYRTQFLGLTMQRPNAPGYNRPDCFVIDDWR